MTRLPGPSGLAIVGLSVACVGLAAIVILSASGPHDALALPSIDTTSIDLAIGTQDGSLSAHDMVPGDTAAATVTVATPDVNR